MAAAEPLSAPDGVKFSRYRSVRKAAQQHQSQSAPPPLPGPGDGTRNDAVTRSMSRYHRTRPTIATAPIEPTPASTPQRAPTLPATNPSRSRSRTRAQSSPLEQQQDPHHKTGDRVDSATRSPTSKSPADNRNNSLQQKPRERRITPQEEARHLLASEAERQKKMRDRLRAEKKAKEEAERAERMWEEQEREATRAQAQRELDETECMRERQRQLSRNRVLECAAVESRPSPQHSRQDGRPRPDFPREVTSGSLNSLPTPKTGALKDRFGFFKRRKTDEAPKSSGILGGPTPSKPADGPSVTIKPGGGGVVPGIDAPVSAVNAGDRRVTVECGKSSILLPVTPTTTSLDLIRSAATCLSEPINPKVSVLLELFGKVGVQRPLRKYERIRDVLNSWDDDTQNTLILVDSATQGVDEDLSASHVPKERPRETSYTLYYSQKPGRWSKRYITLRPDGQMVLAKGSGSKDTMNVCHLSDFDIYSPTARQKAKKIKPPKKICFAIKSQQKSSMFMTTTSFVHFFCTNDKQAAEDFYKAVQGWRSWYLVNVMGEGQKESKAAEPSSLPESTGIGGTQPNRSFTLGHRPSASVDSHYMLGPFKPLLDLNQFSTDDQYERKASLSHSNTAPTSADPQTLHPRKMSLRTSAKPGPLVSFPAHPSRDGGELFPPPRPSVTQPAQPNHTTDPATAFAPTSLLGRTYSQRQRLQRERDAASSHPFTAGPSLLNALDSASSSIPGAARTSPDRPDADARPQRMASVRSTRGGGSGRDSLDLKRTASLKRNTSVRRGERGEREKLRPLVDLTPQYREPPQHAKKGKGFHPEMVGPGGLIDCATSPDVAIAIPPSADWRGRNGAGNGAADGGVAVGGAGAAGERPTISSGPGPSSSFDRTKSLRGHGVKLASHTANNYGTVPEVSVDAFTGYGLLAGSGPSQGGVGVGHGVMSGANPRGGPMIDVREESQFVPGSLLRDVEARGGMRGPIIDREKRRSFEVGTGEGI